MMLAEGIGQRTGRKARRTVLTAAALSLLLLLWGADVARAATTWTVASTNDDTGTTACNATAKTCPTLRDAVNNSSSGDTINLPAGSYTLKNGELDVNHNLTVDGAGANLVTISGNDSSRVFTIEPGVTATISGVTATHGSTTSSPGGGAILVFGGNLTLLNSTVSHSVADQGGGGIADLGTLTMSGSTITGNSAPNQDSCACGGGIEIGSFFPQPAAPVPQGRIGQPATPSATITNSTITGNSAGAGSDNLVGGEGGGIYDAGSLTATNVTIASNTAVPFIGQPGFDTGANVFGQQRSSSAGGFENTIIADPKGGQPNCGTGDGFFPPSKGHNLEDDSAKSCGFTQSSDQAGVNPKLGPLANNGGPTETMALLAGSPAIDRAATIASITTDQRGVHRPQGKAYDIGAYEYVFPADMGIKKSGSPDPVKVGHTLTYTLKVTDHGPGSASNVTVTDKLPSEVKFESVSASKGSCSRSGRTITCHLGTIDNGKSVTIKIAVKADKAGTITNTGRVSTTSSDPNKSNNKATAHTKVKAVAVKPKKTKRKPPFTG